MKTRSIMYISILLIGLVLTLGAVSAGENITETSTVSAYETPTENTNLDNAEEKLSSNAYSITESESLEHEPLLSSNSDDESILNAEDRVCGCDFNSTVIVNKIWEGGDSGNITYVEIQLLHKVVVDTLCPPKWKSSPDEPIFDETVGTIVFLPDPSGKLVSYKIVQTAKLTKENNWRHVFKNLTFDSATQRVNSNGDKYWFLGDTHEYVVREINIQDNVEFISAIFVRNFTCPLDGGLKVFWNITNRIIPNETTNETNNDTNSSNKTDLKNETPNFNDHARGPNPSTDQNKTPDKSVEEKTVKEADIGKATGNPLFILFIMLSVLIVPVLRKRD